VVGPTVYFGSIDDYLYAVNKTTGLQEWKHDLNGHVVSSPTVSKGTIYVGSNNHQVIALDSAGNILWATTTGGNVLDSPTVVKNVVYVGSSDDTLYALNTADGSVKWQKTYANPVQYSPVYVNGTLYFSEGSNLRAVKASSGGKVWTYAGSFPASGPAVADGHVYFGCTCGLVTSLNASTGTQDWQVFNVSANQALTVANGVLFVPPNGSSDLYALATSNGAPLWHVSEGTPLSGFDAWTAPAISDGVVYAGATDGELYAFKP
jgi:outer membrane protein assembly factor BamB